MAAMPRRSPGGHHILLWLAAAVAFVLAAAAGLTLFRELLSRTPQ